MAYRAAPDERLGNRAHFDGGLHPRVHVVLFQCVLQRQRVDHGGQHPHVIARGAVEAVLARRQPAKDVAAADDDGQLDIQLLDVLDFPGDRVAGLGGNAVLAGAEQRLAAQLQHHAPIFWLRCGSCRHTLFLHAVAALCKPANNASPALIPNLSRISYAFASTLAATNSRRHTLRRWPRRRTWQSSQNGSTLSSTRFVARRSCSMPTWRRFME